MTDRHHRPVTAAAGDSVQACHRPDQYHKNRLDTGRVIDRAPPGNHRFLRRAGPRPVIAIDQALIRHDHQSGLVGDGLRGLDRPLQRAGDDQGRMARAQHRPEPRGLFAARLIQRRVCQAAQDAGLVERRLPVPGQVHANAPLGT
jgi:hypothetical protein